MKNKLIFMGIVSVLSLIATGCSGTIPERLNQPIQKAVEQGIKAPGVDLHVNIGSLSPNGLNVGMEAAITNSNSVTLDIGNLQVVAKSGTGRTYIQDTMPGSSIAPNSSRTFTHGIVIPLDVLSERSIVVTIDTRAGAAGITLPIAATVTVNLPDIQKLVTAPGIVLSVNIGQLSSNGLNTSLQANINNPNPLSLDIGNMQVAVKGQSGNVITTNTMTGGSIEPNSTGTFTGSITIPLQVLNERSIVVTIDTRAGAAGITLPVTATGTFNVPKINMLISAPYVAVKVDPRWKATFPLPSLELVITSTVTNNNNIGLNMGDVNVDLYKSDGSRVKPTTKMAGATVYPMSTQTFSSSVTLGSEILSLIGGYAKVIVSTEAGIEGVNERIAIKCEVNFPVKLPGLP